MSLEGLAPRGNAQTVQFASPGGTTAAALDVADDAPVLIHDAARPFLSASVINRLLDALSDADGAVPGLLVADSLRRGADDLMVGSIDREGLWRAQTPQAFRLNTIRDAYAAWRDTDAPTDEAAAVERVGGMCAWSKATPV